MKCQLNDEKMRTHLRLIFFVLLISSPLSAISNAAENIKVTSTLSETGCSGDTFYVPTKQRYSKQQIEWIKNVIQYVYNNESIGGCEFDEFTEEKLPPPRIDTLLTSKKFQDFLGHQLVNRLTVIKGSKARLMQKKNELESLTSPEQICKSTIIRTYLRQQEDIIKGMQSTLKLRKKVNPLAADCN